MGYGAKSFISSYHFILGEKQSSDFSELLPSKKEIVLIYIGISSCAFCNSPLLDSSLLNVSNELETYAMNKNINYNKIGLTRDLVPLQGIKHLHNLDIESNEISSGNLWSNVSLNRYTDYFESKHSTPQIAITYRTYSDSLSKGRLFNTINEEVLVARYVGLEKITSFDITKLRFQ